jgi:hypothetical protein
MGTQDSVILSRINAGQKSGVKAVSDFLFVSS